VAGKAHVLIGTSALRAIRSLRVLGFGGVAALPYVEVPARRLWALADCIEIEESPVPSSWGESLEDVAFPFEDVAANRQVSWASLDEVPRPSKETPLELGVFSKDRQNSNKSLRCSLLNRKMPAAALVTVERNLHIASPELVCVQLASRLSAPALAMVVMELTGAWSLPPAPDSTIPTSYNLAPATTVARIRHMAALVPRARGRANLYNALALATDATASPPEAQLALMLNTAVEDGGYGRSPVAANVLVEHPEAARPYLSQTTYYTDVLVPSALADLEYESEEFHQSTLGHDRRRVRDLQSLGLQVIPVTASDLYDVRSLDRVAWALALRVEALGGMAAADYMEWLGARDNRRARSTLFQQVKGFEIL